VVERELIVGGAVGFQFFALLLSDNGDIVSISASVDDGTKFTWHESRGGYRFPAGSS
jgi:hypothetical protein